MQDLEQDKPQIKTSLFSKLIYPVVLAVTVLLLAISNYKPGAWLTGWDNIHPEFDYGINLERHLFASWQEYQGLGLPAAMGHASDIPRILILWILDLFLPTSMVRYGYMILMLLVGVIGMYMLLKWLLAKLDFFKIDEDLSEADNINRIKKVRLFSFLGSLFFLLNLGTLQNFYTPISMFPTMWAYLPWLFLYFFKSLNEGSRKNYLIFAVITFFAAPMAYTPTLFVVYAIAVFITGIIIWVGSFKEKKAKQTTYRLFMLGLITILMNSFWLIPFLHFYSNRGADTVIDSKMNQMFSLDSYAQNRAAGAIEDVSILRGFWFYNDDFKASQNTFGPLMQDWIVHLQTPGVELIGYIVFGIIIFGLIYSFIAKLKYRYALATLFGISIFIMLNSNPPLGFVFDWLRELSPVFKEALRFPYTKLSPLATFLYAIFFTLGLVGIYRVIKKTIKFDLSVFIAVLVAFGLFLFSLPMFAGNLFNQELMIEIPDQYFEMFAWFKEQPTEPRIANLPQDRYWAWYHYEWGYRGSGFIWYGIKQPVLDRAFDVWSIDNEQYYNEISTAIYENDIEQIEAIAEKYNIGWFVYDSSFRYIDNPGTKQKTYYEDEFLPKLVASKNFSRVESFEHITVIEFTPVVSNSDTVTEINHYNNIVGEKSQFYTDDALRTGDYISTEANSGINYLVRDEMAFESNLISTDTEYSYIQNIDLNSGELVIPKYWNYESYLPLNIYARNTGNKVEVRVEPILPEIYLDNTQIYPQSNQDFKFNLKDDNYIIASKQGQVDVSKISNSEEFLGTVSISESDQNLQLIKLNRVEVIDLLDHFKDTDFEVGDCGDGSTSESVTQADIIGSTLIINGINSSTCAHSDLPSQSYNNYLLDISYKLEYSDLNKGLRTCLLDKDTEECINYQSSNYKVLPDDYYKVTETYYIENLKPRDIRMHMILDSGDVEQTVYVFELNSTFYPINDSIETNIRGLDGMNEISGIESGQLKINYPKVAQDQLNINLSTKQQLLASGYGTCTTYSYEADLYEQANIENDSEYVNLQAQNQDACSRIELAGLPLNSNYIFEYKSQFVEGYPLRVCFGNYAFDNCSKEFLINTDTNDWISETKLIPASHKDITGYNINITNRSRGNFASENNLKLETIRFIPFDFITKFRINENTNSNENGTRNNLNVISSTRVAPFAYRANVSGSGILQLQQAYNENWVIVSDLETEQVLVNNWSNGWELDTNGEVETITIFYWPQVLQFLGLFLAFATIYLLIWGLIFPKAKN